MPWFSVGVMVVFGCGGSARAAALGARCGSALSSLVRGGSRARVRHSLSRARHSRARARHPRITRASPRLVAAAVSRPRGWGTPPARPSRAKNFYEHIHPLFVTKPAEWHAVASMWWKICKNTDLDFRPRLAASWDELVAYIKEHANPKEKDITWLDTMKGKSGKWAACFTRSTATYGVQSTQRIEALHAAIAVWCTRSMLLVDFLDFLEGHEAERKLRSDVTAHRGAFRIAARGSTNLFPGS